ncbi:hypothetical protein ALC53_03483 [Atta colombica]|uniref:Uncharacterized protein n=1 Tax=Atta colombica TaxID=520822 RepID=A0A195BPB6_9HYME|nr:hypothetical protein ALC53_03483 [Atta colombica]
MKRHKLFFRYILLHYFDLKKKEHIKFECFRNSDFDVRNKEHPSGDPLEVRHRMFHRIRNTRHQITTIDTRELVAPRRATVADVSYSRDGTADVRNRATRRRDARSEGERTLVRTTRRANETWSETGRANIAARSTRASGRDRGYRHVRGRRARHRNSLGKTDREILHTNRLMFLWSYVDRCPSLLYDVYDLFISTTTYR